MTPEVLLSEEMKAVADALRHVRTRLNQLAADGLWPEGMWSDVSSVLTYGAIVADALDRLAEVERT